MFLKGEVVKKFVKKGFEKAREKSPTLLTGAVIVGVITTGVSAYKAGLKAHDVLEKYKKDMADTDPDDKEAKHAVIKEAAKEMAPVVIPTVISGGVTIACAIGSNRISNARLAVMTAAYDVSAKSLQNLNEKMKEKLGEKKTREIKDEIVKDRFQESRKNVIKEEEPVILGTGLVLCKELYGGNYFASNASKIEQAIRELSGLVRSEMFVELNEFYDLLGVENKPYGRNIGFSVDDLIGCDETVPIAISAQLTEDNRPCLCVDFEEYLHPDSRYRYY